MCVAFCWYEAFWPCLALSQPGMDRGNSGQFFLTVSLCGFGSVYVSDRVTQHHAKNKMDVFNKVEMTCVPL